MLVEVNAPSRSSRTEVEGQRDAPVMDVAMTRSAARTWAATIPGMMYSVVAPVPGDGFNGSLLRLVRIAHERGLGTPNPALAGTDAAAAAGAGSNRGGAAGAGTGSGRSCSVM